MRTLTRSVFFVISLIAVLRATIATLQARRDARAGAAPTDEEAAPLTA